MHRKSYLHIFHFFRTVFVVGISRIRVSIFTVIIGTIHCSPLAKVNLTEMDVFIVTQGGENIKLGLVEVRVLPYQETLKSFTQAQEVAEKEMAKLQPRLEADEKVRTLIKAKKQHWDNQKATAYHYHDMDLMTNEAYDYCSSKVAEAEEDDSVMFQDIINVQNEIKE